MKLADYEGKTIREIERQNNRKAGLNRRFAITNIALGLFLILLGCGLASFYYHGHLDRLNASIADLQIENGILKEEKASLQSQLAEKQDEIERLDFIFHVVKYQDTLSSISVKYYGTIGYTAELAELNDLTTKTPLRVGQIIKVPRKPYAEWKN
ncbi:LysM peptidoglycan-binding domain-containing protein [Desulfallas thermosapovorans]|uniref:LysM domain-containing protein n=1 Tax=Desulfallas thermosapovorans DSM 6562 TaxID=1121431 RepID=A0A5S4ZNK4_9FIRM|nr:LysM domain-containing protein [Desulfallas thermosapovorans]TYO93864.1 LysM domain-containing protein [Desulfallas thermosapovorans DSM 6562]